MVRKRKLEEKDRKWNKKEKDGMVKRKERRKKGKKEGRKERRKERER